MDAAERPRPLVSFIIPVRNDALRLRGCLESICRNTYPRDRIETIVIDNGSTDGSAAVAEREGATVTRLPGQSVAELRNHGARASRGEVLAFVDADHELASSWAACAVDALGEPRVGAAGAPYQTPPDGTWVQRAYDALRASRPGRRDVEWLPGGNLAVRRDAFDALGGFDRRLATCEDVDLCRRLRAAGWRILSDERLASIHHGDPATLAELFRSELWRGRDNLRVSLRAPLSARGLISAFVPLAVLLLLGIAAVGVVAAPVGGLAWSAASAAGIATLAALRAARMTLQGTSHRPVSLRHALPVALTYDLARALALLARAGHDLRRGAAGR